MSRQSFNKKDKPVVMAGTARLRLTTAAISGSYYARTLAFTPVDSSFGRLISISDAFDLYRFTKLRFRILPALLAGSGIDGCLSFTPSYPSNAPTSLNDQCEIESSAYFWSQQTTHSTLTVSRQALQGGVPVWYKTRAIASVPDLLEYQGSLIVGDESGAARTYTIFIDYVIEFKTPVGISVTSRSSLASPAVLVSHFAQASMESKETDYDSETDRPPRTSGQAKRAQRR